MTIVDCCVAPGAFNGVFASAMIYAAGPQLTRLRPPELDGPTIVKLVTNYITRKAQTLDRTLSSLPSQSLRGQCRAFSLLAISRSRVKESSINVANTSEKTVRLQAVCSHAMQCQQIMITA